MNGVEAALHCSCSLPGEDLNSAGGRASGRERVPRKPSLNLDLKMYLKTDLKMDERA